ncbi:MAG TPA: HD family hydrolase [Thermoanaerobaculia bacterium]|jgi:putative hydrolase of HD superfamily|nr:HD family hydrolase [Thermoanaerobaculia bacterium]
MKANASLLDVFLEIQMLDRIPRAGFVLRGVAEPESVAEHTLHVLFLVWALGPKIEGIDVARAVEIALIHDLAELRIGDLPRTSSHYFPDGAKKAAETAAMADVLAPLDERTRLLYDEYLHAATPEARLVKACDKLQLMLKVAVYERWGTGALAEFWDNPENFPDGGFPLVREIFEELRQRRNDESRQRGEGAALPQSSPAR